MTKSGTEDGPCPTMSKKKGPLQIPALQRPLHFKRLAMPKGVLFTYPISLPASIRVQGSWQYDIVDGEAVTCIRTNSPEGLILYETENAYVLIVTHTGGDAASIQTAADQIAFSAFP